MDKNRRGFLKLFGGAAAAVPLAAGAKIIGADTAEGTDFTAFHFQCDCGSTVMAQVPEAKTTLDLKCDDCGKTWHLEWLGTHWKVK